MTIFPETGKDKPQIPGQQRDARYYHLSTIQNWESAPRNRADNNRQDSFELVIMGFSYLTLRLGVCQKVRGLS